MNKKIKMFFLLFFFLFSVSYAENVEVGSRKLPDEKQKQYEENIKKEETEEKEDQKQTGYYSNGYPAVYFPYEAHNLVAISALGDSIVIEDGSIWKVAYSDRNAIKYWKETDPLIVYPNKAWFGRDHYLVYNQVLEQYVRVTLTHGPLLNHELSKQIIFIDYKKGEVVLNDESYWKISSSDRYLLEEWLVGDYIIIGKNNSLFSGKEYILLNSNMYNHIRADLR